MIVLCLWDEGHGLSQYVLGMEIIRNHPKKLWGTSQEAYIKKALELFCMHSSKPVDTPVKKRLTLSLDQRPKIDKEKEAMSNVSLR